MWIWFSNSIHELCFGNKLYGQNGCWMGDSCFKNLGRKVILFPCRITWYTNWVFRFCVLKYVGDSHFPTNFTRHQPSGAWFLSIKLKRTTQWIVIWRGLYISLITGLLNIMQPLYDYPLSHFCPKAGLKYSCVWQSCLSHITHSYLCSHLPLYFFNFNCFSTITITTQLWDVSLQTEFDDTTTSTQLPTTKAWNWRWGK